MSASTWIPFFIVAVGIGIMVLLLASTRRSLSGPGRLPGGTTVDEGKYPSGYWMTIGMAAGIILGILLGLLVQTLVGGISVGIGIGLILGKVLSQRFDRDTRQYTDEEQQRRRSRAAWGLIVMILLILATLAAALLPLLH